jgi:hypothetical protein
MKTIDPAYVRYIHDELLKGTIQPDNPTDLPEGLIGVYEDAFDERQPVDIRQKLLERFAIWALLKKEVSTNFVAELLEQPEGEIQEFIVTYSAWFNSPETGKYQLYHERLRVFLLQKLSEHEIEKLHDKLIYRLEKAINDQSIDEFELYSLEFLVRHYSINSLYTGDGCNLIKLAYDQSHWDRQIQISKGYIWTRLSLYSVMAWASKYNDDEVIECGIQTVKLQNKIDSIKTFKDAIECDDIESILIKIEESENTDLLGLQRKFILYILCILQLIINDNLKEKKYLVVKILKNIEHDFPKDIASFDLLMFCSKGLIDFIYIECLKININFSFLYKRMGDPSNTLYSFDNLKFSNINNESDIIFILKNIDHDSDLNSKIIQIRYLIKTLGNLNKFNELDLVIDYVKKSLVEISSDSIIFGNNPRLDFLMEIIDELISAKKISLCKELLFLALSIMQEKNYDKIVEELISEHLISKKIVLNFKEHVIYSKKIYNLNYRFNYLLNLFFISKNKYDFKILLLEIEEIDDINLRINLINAIVKKYYQHLKKNDAKILVEIGLNCINNHFNGISKYDKLISFIDCVKLISNKKAKNILQKIVENISIIEDRKDVNIFLIRIFLKLNELKINLLDEKIIEEIEIYSKKINNLYELIDLKYNLCKYFFSVKNYQKINLLIDEIAAIAEEMEIDDYYEWLNHISVLIALEGDYIRSENIANKIKWTSYRNDVFYSIGKNYESLNFNYLILELFMNKESKVNFLFGVVNAVKIINLDFKMYKYLIVKLIEFNDYSRIEIITLKFLFNHFFKSKNILVDLENYESIFNINIIMRVKEIQMNK